MSKLNYDIDAILTGEKQAWDKTVPSFTNEYETGFAGGRTLDQIRQLGTGLRQISISPGDNIQNAINKLNEDGNGGLVTLLPGTHNVDYNITLYSNITLQGLNAGASIIDFNSANFSILAKGSNAYTTGTISVTQGATTVTGSGTSWSSNITAGQNILISGIWYTITNVASDTSLSIAIPFASPTVSGGTYTVATTKSGIVIRELTVQFATGVGIDMQYNDNCNIEHVNIIGCGTGFRSQQASLSTVIDVVSIASGAGLVFNDSNLFQMQSSGALDTSSGVGVSLTSVTNADIGSLFAFNSSGDGIQMTNCENAAITVTSIGNGGQGIEFISGNKNIQLIAAAENNTSDGLKLTATDDENIITSGSYADNGGYGVNIAASSCDNTIITANNFSGNSSGPASDSGTGTVIRGNVGLDDNSAGAFGSLIFGGDGSDGALTVSSGTTTIDLGGEPVVTKNYTSISITGTGVVDFSNPHDNGTIVILKSQGDVTLTSSATPMLDLRGIGAQGVATANGNAGRIAAPLYVADFGEVGQDGQNGANSTGGVAGSGQNSTSPVTVYATLAQIGDYAIACGGAGGAGGDNQTGDGSPGIGGDGGGGLVIECRGALNFTTSSGISVAGSNGAAGAAATDGTGGGGGGAGGTALVLYNTLTAASGSITVSGGTGGTGATGDSGTPGAGGAGGNGSSGSGNGGTGGQGGSASGAGGSGGGAGGGGGAYFFGTSNGSVGSAGTNTGATNQAPGGGGGGGASGYAVITQNKGRS